MRTPPRRTGVDGAGCYRDFASQFGCRVLPPRWPDRQRLPRRIAQAPRVAGQVDSRRRDDAVQVARRPRRRAPLPPASHPRSERGQADNNTRPPSAAATTRDEKRRPHHPTDHDRPAGGQGRYETRAARVGFRLPARAGRQPRQGGLAGGPEYLAGAEHPETPDSRPALRGRFFPHPRHGRSGAIGWLPPAAVGSFPSRDYTGLAESQADDSGPRGVPLLLQSRLVLTANFRGPVPMHPDSEGRRWLKQVLPTLPVDPSLYPQQIDLEQNLALMIQMAEEDYERAAFLDERVISPSTRGSWLPLRGLLEMRGRIRRHLPPAWLFHIGHCGSTLISRLLGAHPHLLALREPATLQMLAYARRAADQETGPELLELCLALLSRSFRKTQRAFIKPTSDCSNLIEPLLGTDREAPAILLYVSLETYAATMLRAAALRADIENRHPARSRDLESRLGKPAQACTDDAQRVAVSWLSSMSAFAQAANAC